MRFSNLPLDYFTFQFHKGTIKTLSRLNFYSFSVNFNSIKVRLKLSCAVLILSRISYFNSIKVRLKPSTNSHSLAFTSGFQFHKGTIKTILILLLRSKLTYFNSIKVRLKRLI